LLRSWFALAPPFFSPTPSTPITQDKTDALGPIGILWGRQMSCYVMLEFTAKPGTGSAVLDALRVALPETRNKEGCESLDVTVNQDDRDNMLLVMRWTSRKHYQTYRDWREANGDVKRFADATVNGLSTRFFDVSDA
jgi:quinol monooxygenase YgiN